MINKIFRRLFPIKKKAVNAIPFEKKGILKVRKYTSYDEYLAHQAEKLGLQIDNVKRYDLEYEKIIEDRYKGKFEFGGKSMLCLAARLGGEVRGFKNLGALGIGIDLEPGEKNPYVLHGDFHDLQFADETFDFAFTNAIDHVYDIERYLVEVKRILKIKGKFIVEFAEVNPGLYETLDTSSVEPILKVLKNYFELRQALELTNSTSYANWSGKLLILEKRE